MKWRKFNPNIKDFVSKERYEEYRENCKCGVWHKRLEIGDEFDLRPVQSNEEAGGLSVIATIVHKKCVINKWGSGHFHNYIPNGTKYL